MDSSSSAQSQHERLYVLSQCAGWLGFTLINVGLAQFYKGLSLADGCVLVGSFSVGLLLSHLFRRWIHCRGWKQLNWPALLPRVVLAVVVLSVLWALLDRTLYLCVGDAQREMKLSNMAVFVYSVFNGTWILLLWSLLYFGYNIADRYRRSEIERAQLQATIKEAELRALKSQVNPHFIFNSLNSLRALIGEEPGRARESVTQLANLLRYSLQSGQLETVPFSEELRIVNDYLALEQVRLEERLRVKLDIDPSTLALPIPPMLLQTLVENAVKYGIANRTEGGEITIAASCDPHCLTLRVGNPGEIAAEGEIPADGANGDSTGLGLRNAAQRLRLLFGEDASLILKAGAPGSVIAEARIPKILMKAAATPLS